MVTVSMWKQWFHKFAKLQQSPILLRQCNTTVTMRMGMSFSMMVGLLVVVRILFQLFLSSMVILMFVCHYHQSII